MYLGRSFWLGMEGSFGDPIACALRDVRQQGFHILAQIVGAAGLIGIVFAVGQMGAEVADPPTVARHCKVYAVRLGKVCHQAARIIGKLGVQVKVIAAALGTELLDFLLSIKGNERFV